MNNRINVERSEKESTGYLKQELRKILQVNCGINVTSSCDAKHKKLCVSIFVTWAGVVTNFVYLFMWH